MIRLIAIIVSIIMLGSVVVGQTSGQAISSFLATNYLSDGSIVKLQAISYGNIHRIPSFYLQTRFFKSASPTIMFTTIRQAPAGQYLDEMWTQAEALDPSGNWYQLRSRCQARPIKDGFEFGSGAYSGPPLSQMQETWEFQHSPEASPWLRARIVVKRNSTYVDSVEFKLPNDEKWREQSAKEEARNFNPKEWLNDELVMAAMCGDGEYVKDLIFQGANPDSSIVEHMSALAYACQNGHSSVVSYLLDHGASVNDHGKWKVGYRTALMAAASNGGHAEIVRLLVERGADVNSRDEHGWTALIWAAREGDIESVKYLLSKGANPNIQALDGKTAVELTEQTHSTNRFSVIELLKKKQETERMMATNRVVLMKNIIMAAMLLLLVTILLRRHFGHSLKAAPIIKPLP